MRRIMEKMTEEVIAGIVVILIVILAGFYFIGGEGPGPGPGPDPDPDPEAIYECSILSKELEEFIDGCGPKSQEISLIDTTSKQKIATLNLINLVKSCPSGCTQVPIRLDADYVTTVSGEGKGYFIIFTKVPVDEEINKAMLQNILHKSMINFILVLLEAIRKLLRFRTNLFQCKQQLLIMKKIATSWCS